MATIKAVSFTAPKMMRVDGTAVFIYDKATAVAAGDVLEYFIPAGLELMNIDLRSAAGTMTFSAGIRPAKATSTIVTDPVAFGAAGQGFTLGRRELQVAALKFDEDTVLTVTTAVAGGQVDVVLFGNQVGVK